MKPEGCDLKPEIDLLTADYTDLTDPTHAVILRMAAQQVFAPAAAFVSGLRFQVSAFCIS